MPYYHGIVSFEYISDVSLKNCSVETILNACNTGPGVMGKFKVTQKRVPRAKADTLATTFGSDSTFFDVFDPSVDPSAAEE